MKIQLKSLTLRNFKGVREFKASFDHVTNIYGRNEAGKTTLFDSFLWLFFGKDSTDRKDFNIKTLDSNNNAYQRLEHEVSGIIDVDGQEILLKKIYKEKWVKKRGETTPEFAGHDTSYYWNEVPMQQKEFDQKIAALVNENLFKLITNTTYFNSVKWQDRRAVLLQMAGKIDESDVLDSIANISNKTQIGQLTNALKAGKSIEEFKKEISAKKKKLKDDLTLIPSRIDEAKRVMPEEKDFEEIEFAIKTITNDFELVESMITDKSKAQKETQNKVIDLMNKKQNLRRLMMDIEFGEKSKVQERKHAREQNIAARKRELSLLQDNLNQSRSSYLRTKEEIEAVQKKSTDLRAEWTNINESSIQFDDNDFSCPTCKRDFPTEQINDKKVEMSENFNRNKSEKLSAINSQGMGNKNKLEDLGSRLNNLEAEGNDIKEKIAIIETAIKDIEAEHLRLSENDDAELIKSIGSNSQYQQAKSDSESLQLKIDMPADVEDNSSLIERKRDLQQQLDSLKRQLSEKGLREKQESRIGELQSQEVTWSQELADLEGAEFVIDSYTKSKMDLLEQRINGKFKLVKFKMFEQQINGGQTETCTTLVNGVPYTDVNTAGKIQAGLDIINALSDHYNVYGPVWVDNRESVTNLPETYSQLINLIVSPEHESLTVGAAVAEPTKALELFY